MKSMEIYYNDLNDEAKERFDNLFGLSDNFNHCVNPLAIYEQEDEESENE